MWSLDGKVEISTSQISKDLLRGSQTLALFPRPWCLGPAGLALPLSTGRGGGVRPQPLQFTNKPSRGNSKFSRQCVSQSCGPGREVCAQWGSCCHKRPVEKHGGENPPSCWALGKGISRDGPQTSLSLPLFLEPGEGRGFLLVLL